MRGLTVVGGALLMAVLGFAGCGGANPPDESTITGLHITTSSEYPSNPAPPNVDVTLTDATPAREIYRATLALPAFPPGTYNCPAGFGYSHTISFIQGQTVAVTATLDTAGCGIATISGAPPDRRTNDAYWALLAQDLGVDVATLCPVPGN